MKNFKIQNKLQKRLVGSIHLFRNMFPVDKDTDSMIHLPVT